MLKTLRFRGGWLVVAAPLLGLLAGCGEGHAKYKPTADEARTSLEAALTAWRDGKPYGPIETKPPVHMVDSVWQGGQQIESFQIGDEEDARRRDQAVRGEAQDEKAADGAGRPICRPSAETRSGSFARTITSGRSTWRTTR